MSKLKNIHNQCATLLHEIHVRKLLENPIALYDQSLIRKIIYVQMKILLLNEEDSLLYHCLMNNYTDIWNQLTSDTRKRTIVLALFYQQEDYTIVPQTQATENMQKSWSLEDISKTVARLNIPTQPKYVIEPTQPKDLYIQHYVMCANANQTDISKEALENLFMFIDAAEKQYFEGKASELNSIENREEIRRKKFWSTHSEVHVNYDNQMVQLVVPDEIKTRKLVKTVNSRAQIPGEDTFKLEYEEIQVKPNLSKHKKKDDDEDWKPNRHGGYRKRNLQIGAAMRKTSRQTPCSK